MTKTTSSILLCMTSVTLACVLGCKSTAKGKNQEEVIAAYEVKLTIATNENAGAEAELALIVEYKGPPQPSRQSHEFGSLQHGKGETKTIKVKATETIPWKNRDLITFYISTQSPDGLLPSHIWIATISDMGNRFTMRDVDWKNKMFSSQHNEPEAVPPVDAAREWVIPLYD